MILRAGCYYPDQLDSICFLFCKRDLLLWTTAGKFTVFASFFQCIFPFCEGALLEKKVEMDKRGMGVTDYNGMVTKPLGCRPPPISKESSMDRPTFLDKVSPEIRMWHTCRNCHSVEILMISIVCLESCRENCVWKENLLQNQYCNGTRNGAQEVFHSVRVQRVTDPCSN